MPQASGQFSGIFICYRRDDSAGHAGRLYDQLAAHFGDEQIFMDIDHVEPGEDFVRVIEEAVGSCEILIALIGRSWLTSRDETGRRLDNPNDFVRLEIAAALARGVRVIPVLVQGAQMPRPQDLPDDLSTLARRHALELSDIRWRQDVNQLISALEKVLAKRREAQRKEARAEEEERHNASPVMHKELTDQKTNQSASKPKSMINRISMEFVLIPAGSYMMGSTNRENDEEPAHRVTIRESFYMGKYEVTQAQWQKVMGNNPSYFKKYFKNCDNCPVECVSWNDAQEFIRKLNEQNDGYTYRLPSEAEWEYVARAGTMGDYAGDLDAMAWYAKNSGGKTRPVGSRQPNAFGLYDMHGNVDEWCQDWRHNSYAGAPDDGSAWVSGSRPESRATRGGSWDSDAFYCRYAFRGWAEPSLRNRHIGFRIAAVARK
jgi:formylglycine-generating enzyme required for sulfatase activity